MKRNLVTLALVALLVFVIGFAFAVGAEAQESTPEPAPVDVVETPESILNNQEELVNTAITGLFLAGFAVIVAFGASLVLLLKAMPVFVVQLLQGFASTLFDQLALVAKRTPTTSDDEMLAKIRAEVERMFNERIAQG